MADEAPKDQAPKKKSKLPLTIAIVAGIAIAEAGVFFFVFKSGATSPVPAQAQAEPAQPAAPPATEAKPEGGHGGGAAKPEGGAAKPEGGHGGGAAKPEGGAAKPEGGHGGGAAKPEGAGAKPEGGAPAAPANAAADQEFAEVSVLRNLRVPNDKSGRVYLYDLEISAVVAASEKDRAETLVKARAGEIGDRLAALMRSAPDRVLKETDLRTLRFQILEALREITGEESLVQRILIPRFVPIRSE
jgi:flagellar basal body-associated protein FliL